MVMLKERKVEILKVNTVVGFLFQEQFTEWSGQGTVGPGDSVHKMKNEN